jgi:hypothetical protein
VTINAAIDNAIAAGVDIEPQWGEDVADTVNATFRRIAQATLAPAATSVSISVPTGYNRYRLTVAPIISSGTDYLHLTVNTLTSNYRGGSRIARYDVVNETTESSRTDALRLGWVTSYAGNLYVVDIVNASPPATLTVLSQGHSVGDGTGAPEFAHARAGGRHNTTLTLSSIELRTSAGGSFSSVRYWLDGAQ